MGDWIMVIEGERFLSEDGENEGEPLSMMNDFILELQKMGHHILRGQVVSNNRQMAHESLLSPEE